MATLKGQNLRILIYDTTASKFKCVGMATSCTINLNTNTEDEVSLVKTAECWPEGEAHGQEEN